MGIANSLWGAPRIHGELLKLGIEIGRTSAAQARTRRRWPCTVIQSVRATSAISRVIWVFIDAGRRPQRGRNGKPGEASRSLPLRCSPGVHAGGHSCCNGTVHASTVERASSAHDVNRFSEYREIFAGPVCIL